MTSKQFPIDGCVPNGQIKYQVLFFKLPTNPVFDESIADISVYAPQTPLFIQILSFEMCAPCFIQTISEFYQLMCCLLSNDQLVCVAKTPTFLSKFYQVKRMHQNPPANPMNSVIFVC